MKSEITADKSDAWVEKARAQYGAGKASCRLMKSAADPNTPGSVLETVAREALQNFDASTNRAVDTCFSVLEAIAAHPNTPPAILAELIGRSPVFCRALCRNPVTPFLLLEQPLFLSDLPKNSQHALLSEADVPALFVEMLAAEGGAARTNAVRYAARLHVRFSEKANVGRCQNDAFNVYWAGRAKTRDGSARHWHADLVELGLMPPLSNRRNGMPESVRAPLFASFPVIDEWLRFKHAEGSPRRAAMMKRLAPKSENRDALAWNLRQSATPDDLRSALHAPGIEPGWIKETVLRHPAMTADLMAEILQSGASEARVVAGLPKVPKETLTDLLQSPDPYVRRLARRHPNAPRDAREIERQAVFDFTARMMAHPLSFVSLFVALNGERERGYSVEKAEDALWTQRLGAVLSTPNTDAVLFGDAARRTGHDLLQHLSDDGNGFVRAAARARVADPDYEFTV